MYRRKDAFYRRAKAAGYRSRAAYKLLELNRSHRLIRPGDRIVDLGAWPGGWLQVAADVVGHHGRVIGVDLQPISPLPQPWVRSVFGDVRDENVQSQITAALGGLADVMLSDMAPKLSGVRDRDEARASELVLLALAVARRLLRPGGRSVIKLFSGGSEGALRSELERNFETVRIARLQATRKGSAEIYALASGYSGGQT